MSTSPEFLNIEIEQLLAESVRIAKSAETSESTRRNYAADWKLFSAWCDTAHLARLPATSETVLLYLTDMLHKGRKVTTLDRHAAALNYYHRQAELPPPGDYRVRGLIQGAKRLRRERPTQKAPLTIELLRRVCGALSGLQGPGAIRNKSILALGFGAALRRSSIAALDLEDVRIVEKGLLVELRWEKQNQKSGRQVAVARGLNPETCPVAALEAWLRIRTQVPGPLYCPLVNGRVKMRRLRASGLCFVVKKAVALIDLDETRFSSHSLRAGFVTSAFEAGAGDIVVAAQTGHRSLSSLRRYLRSSDPFRANASGMIGL